MTPKQVLDSFSETLIKDDRILTGQERALIGSLVHHARSATGTNPELQEAVRRVIATAIGETVAQRAFGVLGGSIVDRILESSSSEISGKAASDVFPIRAEQPAPPSGPQTPSGPKSRPMDIPRPPSPSPGPQTPSIAMQTKAVSHTAAATAVLPEKLTAECVVLDEFLAPQELAQLMQFTLEHESEFQTSEVISPTSDDGMVNYDHRRSRVLMDLGRYHDLLLNRVKSVLPEVLQRLGMEEFAIRDVEAQITASNDGDFFHFHSDNGDATAAARHLTFVYFFHREPRAFEGGELRIHDAQLESGQYISEGNYQTVVPQQNQIVFFPCELMHEITTVKCPSLRFSDSRFTLNGWLRH